ncbi:MAG: SET domain-containing methyltransferase [Nanoarchaeota archaeon]|nr:SET domain-containing methyltransferase [Nanoarchaeota archaeon]
MMTYIIKTAGKKGIGVFVKRNIKKGEVIYEKDYRGHGKIVKAKDIPKLSEKDQNHVDYIGRERYAVDYSPISLINHSCRPNAYIYYVNFLLKKVIAMDDIKKMEEITVNYIIDTTGKWKMKCYCKHKNCLHIVSSDYFKLPKDLQEKYWKYVPRWKKRMLRK